MTRRGKVLIAAAVTVAAGYYALAVAAPAGPRVLWAFDPERTAQLEVDMWKAYYDGARVRLFADLVTLNHEQNRYPWATATRSAFHLARAASTFAGLRSGYDQVLPDLERAYTIARDWTHAGFVPKLVAKAELAWWVARRVPGGDSPDQVGALIADLNAQLYEVPRARVLEASVLRARAGKLRDNGGASADWVEVARLLRESYQSLHAAVQR